MFTDQYQPYLLEINSNPSTSCDTETDKNLKGLLYANYA